MVSFDSKIIYEYDHEMVTDNDPDDRAEISLNQKRLLKSFSDLKLANPSFLHF